MAKRNVCMIVAKDRKVKVYLDKTTKGKHNQHTAKRQDEVNEA